MKRSRVSFALLAFAIVPLSVQAQRTYVSAQHGSDSNPCSVTSPCRTFGAAIAAVAAGGEVIVLDSGGYGAVTVTKSVTLEAPAGIYAEKTVAKGCVRFCVRSSVHLTLIRRAISRACRPIVAISAKKVAANDCVRFCVRTRARSVPRFPLFPRVRNSRVL